MKRKNGFTLIELVMVIVILAILGAVAIPQFVNLSGEASLANEAGVAGGVRAGILTFMLDPARGQRQYYPDILDLIDTSAGPVTCSATAPCFTVVLPNGVTDRWIKLSRWTYRSPANSTNVWTYTPGFASTPGGGSFLKTSN